MQDTVIRRPPTKQEIKAIIECDYQAWMGFAEGFTHDRPKRSTVRAWVKEYTITVHEQPGQLPIITCYQYQTGEFNSYCVYTLTPEGRAKTLFVDSQKNRIKRLIQ